MNKYQVELIELKAQINQSIEHYQRKVKTATSLIDDLEEIKEPTSTDISAIERLKTKRGTYRSIVNELKRIN